MSFPRPFRLIRSAPLRLVLAVPLVVPLVVTATLTGWLSHRNGQQAVNALANQVHQGVATRVSEHLTTYVSGAKPILDLTVRELQAGNLNVNDFGRLETHFLHQSLVFPELNQLYLGRSDGEFTGIVNLGGERRALNTTQLAGRNLTVAQLARTNASGTESSQTDNPRLSADGLFLFSLSDRSDRPGQPLSLDQRLKSVSPFDPRQRPWYQAAVSRGTTVWSQIYPWVNVNTLGLTLAQPYYDAQGQLLGVLGVDLSLQRLNQFLQQLPMSKTGRVLILERSGLLVASSTVQDPFYRRQGKLQRITAEGLRDRTISGITGQIRQTSGELSQIQTSQQHRYLVEGQPQLVQVMPWQNEFGLDWLVIVIRPESDFMGQIYRNTTMTMLLSLVALGLAIALSLWSARWVIAPLLRLNQAAQKLAAGDWAEPLELDRQDEVGQLAQAFNQMNQQLAESFAQLEDKVAQRTEQLQSQTERLQEKESFLRAIYEGVEAAIFTMDVREDGGFRCIDVSPAHSRMSNLAREAIINKSPQDYLEPQAAATVLSHYQESLATRTRVSYENCLEHDGRMTWWLTTVNPLQNAQGQVYRLIVTGLNITQRKEAELRLAERTRELSETLQTLKATQQKLIESAKLAALGQLVAGVAHEVNTPVGTAILAASTLNNETQALTRALARLGENVVPRPQPGPDSAEFENSEFENSEFENSGGEPSVAEYVELALECSQIILENLNRAGVLVQSFKQIAVDQIRFQPRRFAVKPYIQEVVQSLSPQISPTPHRVQVRGSETVAMTSDPGALAQVITNLVMNSLAHAYGPGDQGVIQIGIEVQGDRLQLSYQDDGCGIAPEHLDRIFEPFFTTASLAHNSGLGLHLAYNLVTRRLQGTIAVNSTLGVGTTFDISLPLIAHTES